MPEFDVVIVGGGLAALHAASAVLEENLKVAMIDVGFDESEILERGEPRSFDETRKTDPLQHKIFLGEDLSGIHISDEASGLAGNMTSGRRAYITKLAAELAPIRSSHGAVMQSFAAGGLSEAWGGVCGIFDDAECRRAGLNPVNLKTHYQKVIDRIGVSGPAGNGYQLQPAARLDDNAQAVINCFNRNKSYFESRGYKVEQPPAAILTENLGSRQKTSYRDMDFWDNIGRSVYRGHFTLEELKLKKNFTYIDGCLVSRVEHHGEKNIVHGKHVHNGSIMSIQARAVIMAAGALNTTRILLRSFNMYEQKVPIIIKKNYVLPCLLWKRLGRAPDPAHHSLCQLTMEDIHREDNMGRAYVQLYSYNSLLLSKLLGYVPLPKPEALSVLSSVVPSMMLADVRFPSVHHENRYAVLRRKSDGSDYLEISYPVDPVEQRRQHKLLSSIKVALLRLGLIPLKTVFNAFGSASHYAGGIPFGSAGDRGLFTDEYGNLHRAKGIFVADSASWLSLPAKPPALTIMASADRIGSYVRNWIKSN